MLKSNAMTESSCRSPLGYQTLQTSSKANSRLRQTCHNKHLQENPALTHLLPFALESPQPWTTALLPSPRGFLPTSDLTPSLGQDG